MIEKIDTLIGTKKVGSTELTKEGLYWKIRSRFQSCEDKFYRLIAANDSGRIDLGLYIRKGEHYILDTRIPVKKMSTQKLRFIIEEKGKVSERMFIPLRTGTPFPNIQDLDSACFFTTDGVAGISCSKKTT